MEQILNDFIQYLETYKSCDVSDFVKASFTFGYTWSPHAKSFWRWLTEESKHGQQIEHHIAEWMWAREEKTPTCVKFCTDMIQLLDLMVLVCEDCKKISSGGFIRHLFSPKESPILKTLIELEVMRQLVQNRMEKLESVKVTPDNIVEITRLNMPEVFDANEFEKIVDLFDKLHTRLRKLCFGS